MSNISGWYYDNQLENQITSASLHANMIFTGDDDNIKWTPVPEEEDEQLKGHIADKEDSEFHGTYQISKQNDNDKGQAIYYDKTPICRCICNEDFNVSIANEWSDMSLGVDNVVGSLWNNIRQIAPYKSVIGNKISEFVGNIRSNNTWDEKEKSGERHTWTDYVNHGISWLADNYDKYLGKFNQADYFNRALIMQGTKFSYYGGSNVNFTNLGMRFTLFPRLESNGNYTSVLSQANLLYKYLMGSTENFIKDQETLTGVDEIDNAMKKYLLWEKAPIDFKPDLQNVDVIQQGTLKLKIGSLYAIPNLVCNDANFVFSKQMVKIPSSVNIRTNDIKIDLSPLFCDVSISLRPVSKFSERMLRRLVSDKRETHMKVQEDINNSLKEEIDTIRENYGLNNNSNV